MGTLPGLFLCGMAAGAGLAADEIRLAGHAGGKYLPREQQ